MAQVQEKRRPGRPKGSLAFNWPVAAALAHCMAAQGSARAVERFFGSVFPTRQTVRAWRRAVPAFNTLLCFALEAHHMSRGEAQLRRLNPKFADVIHPHGVACTSVVLRVCRAAADEVPSEEIIAFIEAEAARLKPRARVR